MNKMGFQFQFRVILMFVLFSPLALSEFSPVIIPEQLGNTVSFIASKKPESPTLIILQDAHSDYGAQKSMAEILKYLILSYDLNLVMVEGGDGNVDLSYLRAGVEPDHVREVAERYLKEGKISGEEYLDLTFQEVNFDLWGIEDSDLYDRHMEAYLRFSENQDQAIELAGQIKESLRDLKIKYYPPDIYELETLKERADAYEGSIDPYLEALRQAMDLVPSQTFDDYPTVKQWFQWKGKGKNLDTTKAELEKNQLVRVLSKLATKEEMSAYFEISQKSDLESEMTSIRILLELKKNYEHQLSRYSTVHLNELLRSLQALKALDGPELYDEAGILYHKVRDWSLSQEDAKQVADLSDDLELVEKLLRLEWTPEDEKKYASLSRGWDIEKARRWFPDAQSLYELKKSILAAQRFYEIARGREQAIYRNVVKKMDDPSQKVYALIVGGYHAADLAKMFKNEGFSVMTVSPRFEPSLEPSKYFRILREKWGKNPPTSA